MLSNIHHSVKDNLESFGHKHTHLIAAFCLYGVYTVGSTALSCSWRLFKTFLRPGRNLFKRYQGGYVLVTGATFGLGLEYARQFASKGFNLVLVARNQEKLDGVKRKFKEEFGDIDIKLIVFDFDKPYTAEGYQPLKDALNQIEDISVLVNNVGALKADYFNDLDIDMINTMLQVNLVPQTIITKFMLPKLLERSKNQGKRTAIISLSSVAHYTRMRRSTIYSATKSFNKTLSDVLRKEYGEHIDIMAVLPGVTKSQMITFDAPFVLQPEQHVRWTLSDLGYNSQTFGHYKHWIYGNAYRLPGFEAFYTRLRLRLLDQKKKEQDK
ncbi:unnamed protein product [Moneuplotes crassus]|uniref:Uncharacterized protein n=1 Tax=Euplotes crassus TaxID=5936 RepID=A0AAD1U4V8_EUPCR|nr:unnamed protein product [Moneuplotes crassus]